MRAIVTGGNGFIGSHLVDLLLQRGLNVGIIDIKEPDPTWAGGRIAQQFKVDVADPQTTEIIASFSPTYIFHLAAKSSVSESVENPIADASTTVLGLIRVLEGMRLSSCNKIIYSSSAAIYGDTKAPLPLKENVPLSPLSPYAAAKLAGEKYLQAYSKLYGLRSVALRYANVYGPRQGITGEGGVISIFTQSLLQGRPIYLFGDGSSTRDYIYVGDVVRANWLASQSKAIGSYNISRGIQTSVSALIKEMEQTFSLHANVIQRPERMGDIRFSALCSRMAERYFGFRAEIALNVGLSETANWIRGYFVGDDDM